MTTTPAFLASPAKPAKRAVLSWALYDLANTIFSMNIVSLYFSLWVVNEMGGSDANYGNANSISMALMFFTAAILGALSDQAGRRKPFLIITTLLCVSFTALLGTGGLAISLVFFVVANYLFQGGLIFYDSLLPVVSTEENRGRVGGFGVGLGYMGSFIGVGSGLLLLSRIGYTGIFRLSALLFLLFALPCFFFVKEPARAGAKSLGQIARGALDQTYGRGIRSIHNWPRYFAIWAGLGLAQGILAMLLVGLAGNAVRWWFLPAGLAVGLAESILLMPVVAPLLHAAKYRGLPRFLGGRVLYTDPINTLIERGRLHLHPDPTAAAGLDPLRRGGRHGLGRAGRPHRPQAHAQYRPADLDGCPVGHRGHCSLRPIQVVATLAGVALGGVWAADRPYMLRLAPPRFVGEFYGLYAMVGRFASIIGPFMWGYIVDTLGLGRPAAVASLLVFVVLAFVVLQGVDDRPREWPAELL